MEGLLPLFGSSRITFRTNHEKARHLCRFFGYNESCLFKFYYPKLRGREE